MKKDDFLEFIEYMKGFYPNFKLANNDVISVWLDALNKYDLKESKRAVNIFYKNSKSKYEPTLGQLRDILNINEEIPEEAHIEVKPDLDMRYKDFDKSLGKMNYLVPHYTEVLNLIRQGNFDFVENKEEPSYDDFKKAMRQWCNEVYGRDEFFSQGCGYDLNPNAPKHNLNKQAKNLLNGLAKGW